MADGIDVGFGRAMETQFYGLVRDSFPLRDKPIVQRLPRLRVGIRCNFFDGAHANKISRQELFHTVTVGFQHIKVIIVGGYGIFLFFQVFLVFHVKFFLHLLRQSHIVGAICAALLVKFILQETSDCSVILLLI